MKRLIAAAVLTVPTLGTHYVWAAETSVRGTVYADWMMSLTDGADHYNAFTIDRAYLGAESKLSDYTSLRITLDIRPDRFSTPATTIIDSDGDTLKVPALTAYSGYPIILKYAYGDFKPKPVAKVLKLRLGLQPTMYLNYIEGIWNRRYIERSINDLNSWTTSSDLGLSALASLGPSGNFGEVGVSVLNGTKYSEVVDKNKHKDFNVFTKLTPFYNSGDFNQIAFVGQFYSGVQNRTILDTESGSDWKRQLASVGTRLAYQKKLDLCADVNFQTLGQGATASDLKQSGLSFFGNLYLDALLPSAKALRTLVLWGRYDQYDPNTDAVDDGYALVFAGVECAPIKGVKAAVVYRQTTLQAANSVVGKALMLNTEFKF